MLEEIRGEKDKKLCLGYVLFELLERYLGWQCSLQLWNQRLDVELGLELQILEWVKKSIRIQYVSFY